MKTLISVSAVVLVTSAIVAAQRPFFAGTRPIGFPETPNRTTTTPDPLDNRFGEGTTQRLPIEANGDRDLVDRLSKLPIDKQPFWFINWQALEANRKDPQTYPIRPSSFNDPIPSNGNGLDNRFSTGNGLASSSSNSNVNSVNTPTGSNLPNDNGNLNSNAGLANQQSNNFNSNSGFGGNVGQFSQASPSIPNPPNNNFNSNFGSADKNSQVAQTTVISPTLASSFDPNFDSNTGFYDISGQYIHTPPIVPYPPSNNFNSNPGLGNKNGQFVQTTHRYQWNTFASQSNSQFNRYPEFNTETASTKNIGH